MGDVRQQFDYYRAHQDELVAEYNGKHVVIHDEHVAGSFESEEEAYKFATREFEAGTFLIQLVTPGTESYTQTFHSRVAI